VATRTNERNTVLWVKEAEAWGYLFKSEDTLEGGGEGARGHIVALSTTAQPVM
jgi:hypothetical protein